MQPLQPMQHIRPNSVAQTKSHRRNFGNKATANTSKSPKNQELQMGQVEHNYGSRQVQSSLLQSAGTIKNTKQRRMTNQTTASLIKDPSTQIILSNHSSSKHEYKDASRQKAHLGNQLIFSSASEEMLSRDNNARREVTSISNSSKGGQLKSSTGAL